MTMTIANVEQAAAWDGDEGDHWTEHADWYESAGRRHQARLATAAAIEPTDAVLDVGCGTGASTLAAARAAASGSALGIDLSARMLERARQQATDRGLTNVRFVQADAQVHPFDPAAFDIAISSFGTMFFGDPVAAFTNIGGAVRPGGRLCMMSWRALADNDWLMVIRGAIAVGRTLPEPPPDAPTPFAHADPERVRAILGPTGFVDVALERVDEPMHFGASGDDAFEFLRNVGIVKGLTEELDDEARARALDQLHQALVDHETDDGVLLDTAAWLITAQRA